MATTRTRKFIVTAPGFVSRKVHLSAVRHLGQRLGNRDNGGTTFDRICYIHERSGVEVVLCEDELNRRDRDYTEPLTEQEALAIGMRARR